MLNNWATIIGQGVTISGAAGERHENKPVSFTGPKIFPRYTPPPRAAPTFTPPPEESSFYSYFSKIKKATDVTPTHLNVLGASVEYDVPLEELLPRGTWMPPDDDKVFSERRSELLIANDDALDALARRRRDIRLGYMYRFFQAVDFIQPYYRAESTVSSPPTPVSPSADDSGKAGKRKAEEEPLDSGVEKRGKPEEQQQQQQQSTASGNDTIMTTPGERSTGEAGSSGGSSSDGGKFEVPDKFREDLVKNFIEPICWGYGVRIYPPRAPPKIAFQNSRFLVHLTNHIYFTPILPAEARAGLVEGPIMGVQVRHEHQFTRKRAPDRMDIDHEEEYEIIPDVVGVTREVAAALSLAQDRRKGPRDGMEGKTEKKIRYRAIGKEDKYRDDIFIITSLHHHISISRVSVSAPYLRFLETGCLPNFSHEFFSQPDSADWDRLIIRKTRFWDLLDTIERVEAARALSGVLKWFTRNESKR